MTTFDDFDLNDKLLRGIYSYGFENPSDIQCKALPIINSKTRFICSSSIRYRKNRSIYNRIIKYIRSRIKKNTNINFKSYI